MDRGSRLQVFPSLLKTPDCRGAAGIIPYLSVLGGRGSSASAGFSVVVGAISLVWVAIMTFSAFSDFSALDANIFSTRALISLAMERGERLPCTLRKPYSLCKVWKTLWSRF